MNFVIASSWEQLYEKVLKEEAAGQSFQIPDFANLVFQQRLHHQLSDLKAAEQNTAVVLAQSYLIYFYEFTRENFEQKNFKNLFYHAIDTQSTTSCDFCVCSCSCISACHPLSG